MVLVIGGHGQGKLEYVKRRYQVCDGDVACALGENRVVCPLHEFIRAMEDVSQAEAAVLSHCAGHPDAIYICDEVGCGVVPADPAERLWREAVGRTCVALAKRARRVERVFCGIPMVIKDGGAEH